MHARPLIYMKWNIKSLIGRIANKEKQKRLWVGFFTWANLLRVYLEDILSILKLSSSPIKIKDKNQTSGQ